MSAEQTIATDTNTKTRLLDIMFTSREADRREGILSRQGKGWFQVSSTGHEGLAAIGAAMQPQDYIFPHYRDRALLLARGATVRELALNFLAKRDSSSGGRQLPGHFSSRALRIFSLPSPTGSNLLPACGMAWAQKLRNTDCIVVACVGDGGMRQGEFYEAVCFAREKKLPILFVVEDNGYGISSPTSAGNPFKNGLFEKTAFHHADARDVFALQKTARTLIDSIRLGEGPAILWCELDRLCSHSSSDDHRVYRSAEDIAAMNARCPIDKALKHLIHNGELTPEQWEGRAAEIRAAVEADYEAAERHADPLPEDAYAHITAPLPRITEPLLPAGKELRMLEAVNMVFKKSLADDERVIFFGEDIEDPMGGVFKLTAGLGAVRANRVFNSPLAEGTIVGVGCGLAAAGMRPVFELQFIDFIGPAWNQVITNLSTLRWRSNSEWTCPLIVYAPSGAYLPAGGPWHSQSCESALAHLPGIHVCVPSTPEDAAGLFLSALHAEDPVFILLPKHLLRHRRPVPEHIEPVPIGSGIIRHPGNDITLVTWGNGIELAEKTLPLLDSAVSVEILDLRSIKPWDRELVAASIRKTGRLLVVQEEVRSCSAGQMIITEMLARPELTDRWLALPRLISREDVHIGYHPILEEAVLPSPRQVAAAIQAMLTERRQIFAPAEEKTSLPVNGARAPQGLAAARHGAADTAAQATIPILVPALGEGLEEARIIKFFKKPGDPVKRDELIYQLETDKAVVDIESPTDGILHEWLAEPDATVPIGATIGLIVAASSPSAARIAPPVPPLPSQRPQQPAPKAAPAHHPPPTATLASLEYDEQPISERQQRLAARLTRAEQIAVPATIWQYAAWQKIRAARDHYKQHPATKGITTFLIAAWCVVQATKLHDRFRSYLPQSADRLRVYRRVNIGIAVAMPGDELLTAVVENADLMPLTEFAAAARRQIDLARQGQDQARMGASLILTSMTSSDIPGAIPVIVPPAVGTLFLSAPSHMLMPDEAGRLQPREIIQLSLTFDHRVINGIGAAAFLNDVRSQLENFSLPAS
jgi:2-oxoisovalerate dehydrogenase E1 component